MIFVLHPGAELELNGLRTEVQADPKIIPSQRADRLSWSLPPTKTGPKKIPLPGFLVRLLRTLLNATDAASINML